MFGSSNNISGANVSVTGTTNSTSTSTGSITCKGGVGIAKDVVIGGTLTTNKLNTQNFVSSTIQVQGLINSGDETIAGTLYSNGNLNQVGISTFTGAINANGSIYTPTVMGTNGLEYNTTTSTGIHNFKINGTQKVYINNTDFTNLVNLTQIGDSTFTGAINANGGINGVLLPTNSGGNISGVNGNVVIYNSDGATNAQHQFKVKGDIIMAMNNNSITANKDFTTNGNLTCNGIITGTNSIQCSSTGSNSYYVGGDNTNLDVTAITNPKMKNGIASGTYDGASLSEFNNAINSWYSTGFVDTCYRTCKVLINHRTGDILTNGSISTPTVLGTNGLEHNTTTSTGIHNFKINGTQKVYINNTDLTNTVNLTQIGASTFTGAINANGGVTTNTLNCSTINPNQNTTIGAAGYTTTINGIFSTSTVVTNTVFCGVPSTSLNSGTGSRSSSSQNITLPTSAYTTIGIRSWGAGGGGGAGIAYFTGTGSGSTFTLTGWSVSGGGGGGAGGYNECYFRVKDITSSTITSITCYAGNGGQGGQGNKASMGTSANGGAQGGDSWVVISFASGNPVSFCLAGGGYGGTGGKVDTNYPNGVTSKGGFSGFCSYPSFLSGGTSSSALVTQNAATQSYYGQGSGGGAGASINLATLLSWSSNFSTTYGQSGGGAGMVVGTTFYAFNNDVNTNYSCGVPGVGKRLPGNNGYNFTQTYGNIPNQGQFGYCSGSGGSGGGSSSGVSLISGKTNNYCSDGTYLIGGIGGYGGGGGGGGSMSANGLCSGSTLSSMQNSYCGGHGGSGGAGMIIITFYM